MVDLRKLINLATNMLSPLWSIQRCHYLKSWHSFRTGSPTHCSLMMLGLVHIEMPIFGTIYMHFFLSSVPRENRSNQIDRLYCQSHVLLVHTTIAAAPLMENRTAFDDHYVNWRPTTTLTMIYSSCPCAHNTRHRAPCRCRQLAPPLTPCDYNSIPSNDCRMTILFFARIRLEFEMCNWYWYCDTERSENLFEEHREDQKK